MENERFNQILEQIAKNHHTTVREVRSEMQLAMEIGQRSTDPAVQAKWASIPRKGKELTLEEFVAYIAANI